MGDDGNGMNHLWYKATPGRKIVSYRADNLDAVSNKVESAFRNVKSFPLKNIIFQLWRPAMTTSGKTVLSCLRDACSFDPFNAGLSKYRTLCNKYYYDIEHYWEDGGKLVDDPMTICGAPPSTAFLNHFPEVVLDLTLHRGTPLVDRALECELTCFMMLPVFDQTSCLGVIEVSMRRPRDLAVIYNELNLQLLGVGLCINPPKPSPPELIKAKAIRVSVGILVKSEIHKALNMAFQSHAITLGQVWISYLSRQPNDTMCRTILVKVFSAGDQLSFVKKFYDDLHMLSLKKGEGLFGRTLEAHRPHMCRNIQKLSDNTGVLALLSANTNCTSFVIWLKSSHLVELDFAFEFFWPQSRNHLALIEDLLLTLKEYLPSFKFASGAQLGDELLVVDVDNPSSPINFFTRNELSDTTPKALEETKTSVGVKRGLYENPLTNINNPESEDEDDDDDEDVVILAVYKVDYKLFYIPSSATFEDVLEKINKEFEFNPVKTFKIVYQVVPGEWYSLSDDTCLKSCISSYRTSKNIDHIKLGVLDVEK